MLDPFLIWEISFYHSNGQTYLEQFDSMVRLGFPFPPGIERPKPRRGPCPIKRIPRNRQIVKAVKELQAQGLSLRKSYKQIASILNLSDKAIEKAFRARRRLTGR